jgi:hypothetical protein
MLFVGHLRVIQTICLFNIGVLRRLRENGAPATRVREDGGVEVACASATPPGDALRR